LTNLIINYNKHTHFASYHFIQFDPYNIEKLCSPSVTTSSLATTHLLQ